MKSLGQALGVSAILLFALTAGLVLWPPLLLTLLSFWFALTLFSKPGQELSGATRSLILVFATIGAMLISVWWFTPYERKAGDLDELFHIRTSDGSARAAQRLEELYLYRHLTTPPSQ